MNPDVNINDGSTGRFGIGRLDLCLILLGGLIGTVTVYLLSESIMLSVLIGFNSGMGGLTVAIILLRLMFGRDYLQLERIRTMTDRERLKALFNLAVVLGVCVVCSEKGHPLHGSATACGFLLFCCVMLLYGWLQSKLKAHGGQLKTNSEER